MGSFISSFTNRVVDFLDHLGNQIISRHDIDRTVAFLNDNFVKKQGPFPLEGASKQATAMGDPSLEYRQSDAVARDAYDKLRKDVIKPKV